MGTKVLGTLGIGFAAVGAGISIHSAFCSGESLPQVEADEDDAVSCGYFCLWIKVYLEGDDRMISWNFPGNQDGQIKGVADAGIENFNGTELSSLARENCQNSLDAALDDNNPKVLVEFERYFIHDNQIPGIVKYREILQKCKNFWNASKSEKAKMFLKEAVT